MLYFAFKTKLNFFHTSLNLCDTLHQAVLPQLLFFSAQWKEASREFCLMKHCAYIVMEVSSHSLPQMHQEAGGCSLPFVMINLNLSSQFKGNIPEEQNVFGMTVLKAGNWKSSVLYKTHRVLWSLKSLYGQQLVFSLALV